GRAPTVHPREARGLVDHGLLVAALMVGHRLRILVTELAQGLTDAADVAVAEDAEGAGDGPHPHIAVDGVLAGEERHQRLSDRHRGHVTSPSKSRRAGGSRTRGPPTPRGPSRERDRR